MAVVNGTASLRVPCSTPPSPPPFPSRLHRKPRVEACLYAGRPMTIRRPLSEERQQGPPPTHIRCRKVPGSVGALAVVARAASERCDANSTKY